MTPGAGYGDARPHALRSASVRNTPPRTYAPLVTEPRLCPNPRVHLVFIYLYLGWAMLLLRWHYHQYLTIRQHYLRKGTVQRLGLAQMPQATTRTR